MLPKYLEEAENLAKKFLTNDNVMAMARPSTAGLSSLRNDDDAGEDESDDDDNIIDAKDILDVSEVEVDSDDDG
jgi:hypothetical protein